MEVGVVVRVKRRVGRVWGGGGEGWRLVVDGGVGGVE